MKKLIAALLTISMTLGSPAKADMFGGDVVVLTQILANAIQQLVQLRQILSSGQDTLSLLNDINRGINDSLNLLKTIDPNINPGIYQDWNKAQDAIRKLQTIYGVVVQSPDSTVQQDTDQQVAEAVAFNNSIYDYTNQIDQIGEEVKIYSHQVSPGGAQKLTAQTLGVLLHVMNESLRAQATGLKLQAQTIAVQNKKDKEFTRNTLQITKDLQASMKAQKPEFQMPRF